MPADGREPKDVLLEFVVQGANVKVTAIDPASGVEATIVGPSSGARSALAAAATRKLAYLLEKQKRSRANPGAR